LLESPTLRNAKPLDGEEDLGPKLKDDAGKGGSELGTEGDGAASLVIEVVHLLGDLLSCLSDVQLFVLENGGVEFLEAKLTCYLSPVSKQPIPC